MVSVAEMRSFALRLTEVVRCPNCLRAVREPQRGVCEHSACATCWGSSGRRCAACGEDSGADLRPSDPHFATLAAAVADLEKAIAEFAPTEVCSEASGRSSEDKRLDECFYEKDNRYLHTKTYERKISVGSHGRRRKLPRDDGRLGDSPDAKVNRWLESLRNEASPDGTFEMSRRSVAENDKPWLGVKKTSKMLQKGKATKKKLNVSLKNLPKRSSIIDLNDSHDSVHLIEDIGSPEFVSEVSLKHTRVPGNFVNVTKSKSHSLDKVLDKDELALREVLIQSKRLDHLGNLSQNTRFSSTDSRVPKVVDEICNDFCVNDLEIRVQIPDSALTKVKQKCLRKNYSIEFTNKKIVPFFWHGTLSSRRNLNPKKKIPFYFKARCSNESLKKNKKTQTSPISKLSQSHCENDNRFKKKSKLSLNNVVNISFGGRSSINMSQSPRMLKCNKIYEENDESSNTLKKKKLIDSEAHVNEDIVINFESQSQINKTSESSGVLVEKQNTSSSGCLDEISPIHSSAKMIGQKKRTSDVINHDKEINAKLVNDEKFQDLKKAVDFYTGNISRSQSLVDEENKTELLKKKIEYGSMSVDKNCGNILTPEMEFPDVVDDTPQKSISLKIIKNKTNRNSKSKVKLLDKMDTSKLSDKNQDVNELSDMEETLVVNPILTNNTSFNTNEKKKLDTPSSITKFTDYIKYQSTPLQTKSRKSLNYDSKERYSKINEENEISSKYIEEQNLDSPSNSSHIKTYLENEFVEQAFENSLKRSSDGRMSAILNVNNSIDNLKTYKNVLLANKHKSNLSSDLLDKSKSSFNKKNDMCEAKEICVTCSCLPISQKELVKSLSSTVGWSYNENFTKNLTHMVVKVDRNNAAQRSVKFVQAIALGCWIVSFDWVQQCMKTKSHVKEDDFEVVDTFGGKGPSISRTSTTKLFKEMTFHCLQPINTLSVDVLEEILLLAGGKVVKTVEEVTVKDPKKISILLAEVENTQDDRFIDLCMMHSVVPVNIQWVLESIGNGNCSSFSTWVLASRTILPKMEWPQDFIIEDDESLTE